MNLLEVLGIDKCFCICTYNPERFKNVIQLKKDLDIEIELVSIIKDDDVKISQAKNLFKFFEEAKNKGYRKILVMEDDAWTDLTSREINEILIKSGILSMKYGVLSLGSQTFKRETINDYLYKSTSFSYGHAVVYNIECLNDDFFNMLEEKIFKQKLPADWALSQTCLFFDNALVIKDSIFLQAYPSTTIKNKSGIDDFDINSNIDFRYTRDSEILDDFKIFKINKEISDIPDYLNKFVKDADIDKITFNIKNLNWNKEEVFRILISDYNSGMVINQFSGITPENFWVRCNFSFEKVLIEIYNSNNVIVFRQSIIPDSISYGITEY